MGVRVGVRVCVCVCVCVCVGAKAKNATEHSLVALKRPAAAGTASLAVIGTLRPTEQRRAKPVTAKMMPGR